VSNYKAGDKVLVLCKVIDPCESLMKVTGSGDENWFWAGRGQCRPVEPIAKEPTRGQKLAERTMKAIWAANDAVNGTPVIKESLTTESNSPKILDSSSKPIREAFESSIAKRYDWDQTYFSRNDNRYFDSSVEMAWQAFQAGAKYQSSPMAPSPCMDGLQVGDAVRFVSPGHNRHGTQGVLKSIHHGPKNAYLFVSNCGQFHRYCTIAELERVDQADPIDIKGSMQSLDGADTIQAGDLQWTDRDGKYRLCNFTIGMRVHEAIERGKAHGEKWVFYRKFREVGE
jgi:hypothetical protein